MYDYVGNRTVMQVTDSGGTRNHVYSYDSIYQLTDVTNALNQYTSVGNVQYLYDIRQGGQYTPDQVEGRLYDGGSNMYAYDAENRLLTVTKTPDALSAACDTNLTLTTRVCD